MTTLTAHFVVSDPSRAADWYIDVLGAAERNRIVLPDGQVLTVELALGDTTIAVGAEFPALGIVSPLTLGGTYGALHLGVDDVDTLWQKAVDAGVTVFEPLHDAFWGDRTGQFLDPFGHRWALDQHVRDVPADEVARLAAEAFAGAGQS